jgi:2'-hydroxyisoflavone reductase
MRVLVLGGTVFLGRHVVGEALARGDEVTLFNRGRTAPGALAGVETVHGDRERDLGRLAGRRFDVVVDTSGYVPRVAGLAARTLAGSVERYVFVSSCSVYAAATTPNDELTAPLAQLDEPGSEDVRAHYGALKALCEQAVEAAVPGRALHVRAGLIVGPHDPTNRFTYWVTRLARGGDVLAPSPPDQPVQVVDARDLARFMLDAAEAGASGPFNALGPAEPLTLEATLRGIAAAVGADARLVWAPEAWLLEQGVEPWMGLPLWLAAGANPDHAAFMVEPNARAVAAGLRFRPLAETARDTLEWSRSGQLVEPADGRGLRFPPAGIAPEREAELLAALRAGAARA